MSALLVDRNFTRTHVIGGFQSRVRCDFDGLWAMAGDYAADFSVYSHYHSDFMIDTIIGGNGAYRWKGGLTPCRSGTVFAVRPGQVHDSRPNHGGMTILSLGASPEWLRKAGIPNEPRHDAPPHPLLALQVFRLFQEMHTIDAASHFIVQELVAQILAEALGDESSTPDSSASPKWLNQVLSRLHDDVCPPPSLRTLADDVGVHFTHLARVFKAHQRCTIGEYHRRLRIQKSMMRLIDSRAPIGLIALQTGFCDQSHYNRCFRRYVGTSPASFRKCSGRFDARLFLRHCR